MIRPAEIIPRFQEYGLRVHPARPAVAAPPPPQALTGIAELDAICAGLPRGAITEISGVSSSGLTTLVLALLAAAAEREEVCALVDAGDGFDPATARAAGVDLERLLWVRCRSSLEGAFRSADLVLEGGGFSLVVLDLGRIPAATVRRIPAAFWFRFRRALAATPTALVSVVPVGCAGSSAALALAVQAEGMVWRGNLLVGRRYRIERLRPRVPAPACCRIEANAALG
jgi:hypothetical protein